MIDVIFERLLQLTLGKLFVFRSRSPQFSLLHQLSHRGFVNMRTLVFSIAFIITVGNAFLAPILKRMKLKHPELFKDEQYSPKFGNLGGVPNITLCTPPEVTPELTWNAYNITPDDIEPNEQIYVTANATLSTNVTDGNVHADIAVGGINLYNEDIPLCDIIYEVGLECPVSAGPIYISEVEVLPEIPYHGLFNVTVDITDQNGKLVTCVTIITSIN